jgi:hypothetical protein
MGLEEIVKQDNSASKIHPFPKAPQRKQKVPLSQLINKLNRLNFKEEPILFNLKHRKHGNTISMHAHPRPCMDSELECTWLEFDEGNNQRLKSYDLTNFIMTDGQRIIQVTPSLVSIDGQQITVSLPEESLEIHSRMIKRHLCPDIEANMVANSSMYQGQLLDFNAFYFRVALQANPPQTFDWINSNTPMNLTLRDDSRIVYIGDCSIVRQTTDRERREYVLQPTRNQFPRYRAKENRSVRRELLPNLNVAFKHPVTKKTMSLKMADLSGSGFALVEPYEESTLLPGMILQDVGIHLTSRSKLMCTAQVIHRAHLPDSNWVKVGLALLDIDPLEHMELVSLLQQARDPDTYVSNHVDPEALWDFFFETGFIYPQKYASMVDHKEQFKETYSKLYTQQPDIARHFTHMEHNQILGHFGLLRLYNKTWCLHHHAALSGQRKSGLLVLERLSDFINDTHLIDSANNHYTAGFYRSTNKFPARYFGGMTKYLDNPKASSIDAFAYLSIEATTSDDEWNTENRWELTAARKGDLEDLCGFYEKVSGGLLLDALDMTPESLDNKSLSEAFSASGFKREIHYLSIRKNGELKAVLAVNRADMGLNFSELPNTTQVFVVDGNGFKPQDFRAMLSQLAIKFNMEKFPVMVYPTEFMTDNNILFEKTYCCNILSSQYWDDYMRYMLKFMKKAKVR